MILYSVYIHDGEIHDLLFRTYDEEKAYGFSHMYNTCIPHPYEWLYITEEDVSPDVLEPHADNVIKSYEKYKEHLEQEN